MNRTLSLLLSRFYDGALAPEHAADLAKSGLNETTIREHYIRSVPPAMIRRLFGFDPPAVRSALLFPFRSPAGGFMNHVRVKVFPPLTDAHGHAVKYFQPKNTPPRLYFTLSALRELHGDRPLWLVEGEKKALAVGQVGLAAVGLCGIDGWHAAGARNLLPDFDGITLAGRVVELVPDSDVDSNPHVEAGTLRLARALKGRGATVRLVKLPTRAGAARNEDRH